MTTPTPEERLAGLREWFNNSPNTNVFTLHRNTFLALLDAAEADRLQACQEAELSECFDLCAEVIALRAEADRLREREAHFASVLGVADGGEYRNDWDASIRRVLAERDRMRDERDEARGDLASVTDLVNTYARENSVGEAMDVSELRGVISSLVFHICGERDRMSVALLEIAALADESPCECEGCSCDLGLVVEKAIDALAGVSPQEALEHDRSEG